MSATIAATSRISFIALANARWTAAATCAR